MTKVITSLESEDSTEQNAQGIGNQAGKTWLASLSNDVSAGSERKHKEVRAGADTFPVALTEALFAGSC